MAVPAVPRRPLADRRHPNERHVETLKLDDDGKTRRKKLPELERLKAWVRSGGRCVICNRYLLEGDLGYRELTFGELAHIVGQQNTEKSPRGLGDPDIDDRDVAENVLLVCDDEHDEIDKRGSSDLFSVELLRQLKREHEERIFHVTGFAPDRRTIPIRMIGHLRGNAVEIDRNTATAAVIRGAQRFPRFPLSYRDSIEIDLRNIPGENVAGDAYYGPAMVAIDDVIDHKLHEGITREEIQHVSVFAFARIPLLVYLGTKLDDNVPVDIYQRHRSTDAWEWPDPDGDATFTIGAPDATSGTEAVLVMNVSGSIHLNELPAELAQLPVFTLAVDQTPAPDIFSGPNALASFNTAVRSLLSHIEAGHKRLSTLHVFAAVPMSAAIAFGKVFDPSVHPSVILYDRTDDGYQVGLKIGSR
jgi:hypothetical protein